MNIKKIAAIAAVGTTTLLIAVLLLWPQYRVYSQTLRGKAKLKEQEFEKLVLIEEAKAQLESAELYKQAEVIRAQGVAEANEIIGESLKNNESYLHWRWIEGLHDGNAEVIYIPTEASLPLWGARERR